MTDRRTLLTAAVVLCILGVGIYVSGQLRSAEPLAANLAIGAACLFAFALIRSTLIRPYLVTKRWFEYAKARGWKCLRGRHGEPRMVGDIDGHRFILSQSTAMLGGGGGYYARTVATAAIEHGIPDGLRVYRRDALEWMHQLSGLRELQLEDPRGKQFMMEGTSSDDTTTWLTERLDTFADLGSAYPRFIVYGSEVDGLPAAAGGASGALTLIVVGRRSTKSELDALVDDATRYARALGGRPREEAE